MKEIIWAMIGGLCIGLLVVSLSDISFSMPPVLGWDHIGSTCLDEVFNTVVFLGVVIFAIFFIGRRHNET